MKNIETTAAQRTERIKQLASRFKVEPNELKLERSGLDSLIEQSHLEVLAGVLAGIEFGRQNKELAEKIAGMLKGKFDFLNEGETPGNAAQKHGLDLELDVLPALQWLRFMDGYKASIPSEADQESIGEPILLAVKQWLSKRTYTEKLTAILVNQLMMVESMYEAPDDLIGSDYLSNWRSEIADVFASLNCTEKPTAEEMAISGFVVSLFPVRV